MTAQATSASSRSAPGRPARRRDPGRKERILVAAAALGARRGFDAISMADIGAEAGIVGSGVYRHFDSKTAILVAMADRVMDRLRTRSATIIAAGLDEGQTLTLLVRDHIEVALTDRDALAAAAGPVRPGGATSRARGDRRDPVDAVLPQRAGRRAPHRAARGHGARLSRYRSRGFR
jgi:AcrR family transcriptional regulator